MVDKSLVSALVESSIGEWGLILGLVFGGCCSNVWALEGVLKEHPKSGTFLTFVQFLYVTITTLSSQLNWRSIPKTGIPYPTLKTRKVPIGRWAVQVVLFLAVSLMNNYAFGLKIPVTVHIIFRSGGLCVSMIVGSIFGKRRYSFGQVLAALLITSGIILATISAPRPRQPRIQTQTTSQVQSQSPSQLESDHKWIPGHLEYLAGVGLLTLAMIISAFLGLWQEQTYKLYGKEWKEALFYGHALSLPFFLPFQSSLKSTFKSYSTSKPIPLSTFTMPIPIISSFPVPVLEPVKGYFGEYLDLLIPSALLGLAINIITQGICVRGVNRLTSKVNSVTVNLVLTIRKAISLAISVWWYGSGFNWGLGGGGLMVLLGTLLYSLASGPKELADTSKKEKEASEKRSNGFTSGDGSDTISESISSSTAIEKDIQSGLRNRQTRTVEG